MASAVQTNGRAASLGRAAEFVDRWIFVFTAGLFLAAVLVGFVPDSVAKIAAVRRGLRPDFPLILHVHAVLMGLWVLLLVVQTVLMASGQRRLHRALGLASVALAPAMVVVALCLAPVMLQLNAAAILNGPPAMASRLQAGFSQSVNMLLIQCSSVVRFSLLIVIALLVRRNDGATHKRLMIFGTVALFGAATTRIPALATTLPASPLSILLWPLTLIVPLALWDWLRRQSPHFAHTRAYLVFVPIWLATALPVVLLWNTPGWHRFALRLLGLNDIPAV